MLLLAFTPCLANDYPIHTKISSSFLMRQSRINWSDKEFLLAEYNLRMLLYLDKFGVTKKFYQKI